MVDGYGITETGPILINGRPLAGVEIKIVDVPAMGYFSSDDLPRGELWVRTPNLIKGYFNQSSSFGDNFKDDGWYATGDIVQREVGDTITIIDRCSSCFKLAPHKTPNTMTNMSYQLSHKQASKST